MGKLTAKRVESLLAKAAKGQPVAQWHPHGENGLALRIRPTGAAAYYVRKGGYKDYRLCDAAAGLKTAVDMAAEVAAQRARNQDPSEIRKAAKAEEAAKAAKRDTVADAVDDYIEQRCVAKKQLKSVDQIRGIFRREVVAPWGKLRVTDITKPLINQRLTAILKDGRRRQAELVYVHLHTFFAWLVENDYVTENIVAKIERPDSSPARERVLDDKELALVWRAAGNLRPPYDTSIRFMMISGQRKTECSDLPWRELNLDERTWSLPKERTKNGKPHKLPLPALAVDMLRAIERRSDFVFTHNGRGPARSWGPRKNELDEEITKLNGGEPIPHWTLHDLRRSAATGMSKLDISTLTIETALNHLSGLRAGVAGIYNRDDRWPHMIRAYDLWANHLQAITGHGEASTAKKRGA